MENKLLNNTNGVLNGNNMESGSKVSKFSNLFMFVILLLPVLAQYSIFNGVLDFDVISVTLLFICSFFMKRRNSERRAEYNMVLLLILYTGVTTLIGLLAGTYFSPTSLIILRCGRYVLYLFVTFFIGLKAGNFNYFNAMRMYRVIAYAAFFYISLQAVLYYSAGIVLPNRIGAATIEAAEGFGRLRAFYSEPADMAYSIIPFVVCSLMGPKYNKKDTRMRDSVLISLAVILTTSGQGIISLAILWGVWIFLNIMSGKFTSKKLGIIIVVLLLLIILYEFGILDFALGRISTAFGGAVSARLSGYQTLTLLSEMQLIFGVGYGNYVTENIYNLSVPYKFVNYSSLAEIMFTTGIIGLILLLLILYKGYRDGKKTQRVLLLIMFFLMLGGCPLSGKYIPIYMSFIFCRIPLESGVKPAVTIND